MGKRTRRQQRAGTAGEKAPVARDGDAAAGDRTDAERFDAAEGKRREPLSRRAAAAAAAAERNIKARPPAPWDPFPLTELAILLGLICMGIGYFTHGSLGRGLLVAGLTLAALGGLDTILREHFNGYRAHSGLLAGMLALLALIVGTAIVRIGIAPRAAIAIGVFALAYPALRRDYLRRSGGRSA